MKNLKESYVVFVLFCLIAFTFSCMESSEQPGLKYDHIILFANEPALKDSLDRLFTPAEKLTTEHPSQGTIGYYYLFYNTYIELLYLKDSAVAQLNKSNFGSDYLSRWNQSGEVCPMGFGLSMTRWDSLGLSEEFQVYQSDDAPDDEYYMMSIYNNNLSNPLLYVSLPHRRYQSVESLDDINQKPAEIQNDLRAYLTHKTGVKNLTGITYNYSNRDENSQNLYLLDEVSSIKTMRTDQASLSLSFDSNERKKRKEFLLNDQLKLVIRY